MPDFKVGSVTSYFDKIGVAIISTSASLAIGDLVRIGSPGFTQKVESLQIEHEKVNSVKAGELVGLKTSEPTSPGDDVFLVS